MECALCAGALSWCSTKTPPPVSVASCEKQKVSDVSKLVGKTVGLQFGLVERTDNEQYPPYQRRQWVLINFYHTLYVNEKLYQQDLAVCGAAPQPTALLCVPLGEPGRSFNLPWTCVEEHLRRVTAVRSLHQMRQLISRWRCLYLKCSYSDHRPGPPHYHGFTTTLRHTTSDSTPLDGWSARRRDNTQHSQQTKLQAPSEIWAHNPSKRAAADPGLDRAATGICKGDSTRRNLVYSS
jgi:hypothetical protein